VRRHGSRIKQKMTVPTTSALACQNFGPLLDFLNTLPPADRLLTPAEIRVVTYLCHGFSSKEIARALNISPRTVDKHREHVLRKLGIYSTRQLTAWVAGQYAKSGLCLKKPKLDRSLMLTEWRAKAPSIQRLRPHIV
jgi:DNA-binding CsgD family transcriptional regulator